ncbi:MAG: hypothetical protein ACLSGA_10810 [Ruminococcus sp.]
MGTEPPGWTTLRRCKRSGGGSDAIFTPELTKTSKDSKRERDRENKNKER